MPWRPLNDVIFLETEGIERYQGSIVLPQKNSEEKISPFGTIVTFGNKCKYPLKVGQRVRVHSVNSPEYTKPQYLECEGKKYRLVKEHDLLAVFE